MNRYVRSLVLFFTLSALMLGVFAAVNVVVDPYTLYGSRVRPFVNQSNPDLGSHSNFVKAAEIIKYKPARVILGSSIVDGGFNLNHLYQQPGGLDVLPSAVRTDFMRNGPIYNAGVRGGSLWEVFEYLKHAKANNPDLDRAILGLEHGMFTELNAPIAKPEFDNLLGSSWFSPRVLFDRTLSWTAVRDSIRVLVRNNQVGIDRAIANGGAFWGGVLNAIIRTAQAATPDGPRPSLTPEPSSLIAPYPVLARSVPESRALVFSAAVVNDVRKRLEARGPSVLAREDAYATVREIVAFAHDTGIRLDVYISPQHWIYWATWESFGQMPHIEDWWRRLAEITPFWYFGASIEQSARVDEFFEIEGLHYNWDAGAIILESLLADESPAARRVTRQNVEAFIARKRSELRRKLAEEAYIGDVLAFTRPERVATGWDRQAPQSFQPEYRGFRIVRSMERYYAAPADQAPFDLLALLEHACAPVFEGATADEVLDAIDRAAEAAGEAAGEGAGDRPEGSAAGSRECLSPLEPAHANATFAEVNRRWPPVGAPIASGTWVTPPEAAFDGNPSTFWPSNLFGGEIVGNAWIGFAFDRPRNVRAVTLLQRNLYPFRQDAVLVQRSADGGQTWQDVGGAPFRTGHERDVLVLPPTEPATHWRLVAQGGNASNSEHAWSVREVQFLEQADTEFREVYLRGKAEGQERVRP